MNRMFRTLTLVALAASLAGCVGYPGPYYGHGGGYRAHGYASQGWGGRGYAGGYGGGYRGGWR